jgi:hypothetical protein
MLNPLSIPKGFLISLMNPKGVQVQRGLALSKIFLDFEKIIWKIEIFLLSL